MPSTLPFRYTSPMGEHFELDFRLHPDTVSAMRVSQLLERVLETLDREIGVLGDTANGDVLQALSMALAVRAGLIHADQALTGAICNDLLKRALASVAQAQRRYEFSGRA
jgi:hypothetical protein